MKNLISKLICLVLCALFLFSTPLSCFVFAKNSEIESRAVIEEFYNSLDDKLIITEHEDGAVEISMKPLSAYNDDLSVSSVSTVYSQSALNAGTYPDYTYTSGQTHIAVPYYNRYLYTCLTDLGKQWYNAIDSAVRNLDETAYLGPMVAEGENYKILFIYLADHPEYFYVCNRLIVYTSGSIGLYYSVGNGDGESSGSGQGPMTAALRTKIASKKATFDNAVNAIVSSIPSSAPQIVKEALIYNKILVNSYYNLDAVTYNYWDGLANDNWTAYGILCNGYGVCESYSEAFQVLCTAVGIKCTPVVGDAGGGHKWNAVEIDGRWYQCDITFDDPIGGDPNNPYFDYFNITDSQMLSLNHTWTNDEYPVPACSSTNRGREYFKAYHQSVVRGVVHCFTNACDATCDNCSYTRYVSGHDFVNGVCTKCGYGNSTPTPTPTPDTPSEPDLPVIAKNGWYFENGNWYYYENDTLVRNQWRPDARGLVYLGSDGAMVTNSFLYDSYGNEMYYLGPDGYVLGDTWVLVDGNWYYLNNQSRPLKNTWHYWQGDWYYLDNNGHMLSNAWKEDSVGWCYLGSNGAMMKANWLLWNGDWYYLAENGYMLSNTWKEDSVGWCYLGSSGAMMRNAWVMDSVGWCFVGADGYCVTDQWKSDSSGRFCYLNQNGNMVTSSWVFYQGNWYYCDAAGYRVTSLCLIDNAVHLFDRNGIWLGQVM